MEKQKQNYCFYESLSLKEFLKSAKEAGVKENKDLITILPYLKKCKKVLDLGSGYGRCLNFLIKHLDKNVEIHSVEFSKKWANFLKRKFNKRVRVHRLNMQNILSVFKNGNFDCVISGWGSINHLNFSEQIRLLSDLKYCLSKESVVFIETIIKKNKVNYFKKFYHCHTKKFFWGYIFSEKEFREKLKRLGYKVETIKYKVYSNNTNKERIIYKLQLNNYKIEGQSK